MSRLLVIAVVGLVVVGSMACGSSAKPAPPPPAPSAPVAAIEPAAASAPEPSPAPAPAPVVAPPPPPTCAADADCNFAEGAEPARCVVGPAPAAKLPAQPGGSCVCLAGGCALRPAKERISQQTCDYALDDCELDLSTARCEPGLTTSDSPRGRASGPSCSCGRGDQRCHLRWYEPVPCKTVDDCWSTDDPVSHAIPRPRRLRGRTFRGCVDGEHVPTCVEGRCALQGLKC